MSRVRSPGTARRATERLAAARRFLPIGLVALLIVAILASGAWRRLSLHDLAAHHGALSAYVAAHPAGSLAIYAGVFTAVVLACLPGISVLLVAGGYLFGTVVGGAFGLAAATLGSMVVFAAARTAFGDGLARRAGPRLTRLRDAVRRDAFAWLLTLRLLPAAPYFVATLAAALAPARARDLVAATVIGSAPACFLLAGLGAGLGETFAAGARPDASLLAEPRTLLPLSGLALLSVAPWAWRRWRRTRNPPGARR